MAAENSLPASFEEDEFLGLTDYEESVVKKYSEDLSKPYNPGTHPVDDKKRPPFPEEIEWGVPGADYQE